MSTRRARIKAVTALPPRRKNVDSVDKNKSKEISEINTANPTTIPTTKPVEGITSARTTVSPIISTPVIEKNTTLEIEKNASPKSPAKLSASTGAATVFSNFISPQSIGSPIRRHILSPSPQICKNIMNNVKESHQTEARDTRKVSTLDERLICSTTDVLAKGSHDIDDYNVPSVPESIIEDTVMDGIVPLQPANTVSQPIDVLKNQIISENAEVLFDPIVPLPSPSKVRPKLRPAPRLGPLRRSSVQGSASESEDESRRAMLNNRSATPAPLSKRRDSLTSQSIPNSGSERVRNDSICSNVSQLTSQQTTCTSQLIEKQSSHNKSRRQEISRRLAAMRKRRESVTKDKLTMYDLIFYNPMTNPIVLDDDEIIANQVNEQELSEQNDEVNDPPLQTSAVPQIKLGANGEIILDEESLVVKQSNAHRKPMAVVREGPWSTSKGFGYRRGPKTAEWSDEETVRFYRALAAIGTDFTLMQPLFPDRTRRDLKVKFKKEEKINCPLVDKALRSRVPWDADKLKDQFTKEREEAERKKKENQEKEKALKKEEKLKHVAAKLMRTRRQNIAAKALGEAAVPAFRVEDASTSVNDIHNSEQRKRLNKQNDPLNISSSWTSSKPRTPNSDITQKYTKSTDIDLTNIESGSLVVLTVNDPQSPSKKMLQTYVAHESGKLTPVALPPALLNSVVGYMATGAKVNSLKSNASTSSSPLTSPQSVASSTNAPSPFKRQRHSSFTVTQL